MSVICLFGIIKDTEAARFDLPNEPVASIHENYGFREEIKLLDIR